MNLVFTKYTKNLLIRYSVLLLTFTILGCSSPTERANHYYEKGMALIDKDPNEATKQFQNAIQLNKSMSKAYYALATIAEKRHDLQLTYNYLSEVVALDPKNLQAQLKLSHLYLSGGKPDLAIPIIQKALTDNPDNADVLALHALALLKTNDMKNAVIDANKALAKNPDSIDALLVLAYDRFTLKDNLKAIDYIDKGLSQDKKNLSLLALKGNVYEQMGDIPKADEAYQSIISNYPDNLDFRYAIVAFYTKNKLLDKAEAQLRTIVEKIPTDIKAKVEVVKFMITTRGIAAGRAEMEAYVKKEPNNYALKFTLAEFYEGQKDASAYERILNEITLQAKDSPDGLKAKAMLGNLALSRGDKATAKKLSDEILSVDKNNEQALIIKAGLEIDTKNLDAAIADLRLVLRDSPNSARALILLATAFEASNSMALAEEQYTKAFQASKMATPYAIRYASFLFKRNQITRAEDVLNDAIKANSKDENLLLVLADIKIHKGDWLAAQDIADKIKANGDHTNSVDKIVAAISEAKQKNQHSIESLKKTYEATPNTNNLASLIRAYGLAGQYKLAQSYLSSILNKDINNTDALMMQGQMYAIQGENVKAMQSFKTLVNKAPKNPAGYKFLSAIYIRDNKMQEAEDLIHQGLAAIPDDFELNLNLAMIKEKTSHTEDAIKIYEALLRTHADSDLVNNNLASLLCDTRKDKDSYARAYELAKKIKLTQVVQFKDTLGWASYKVGKYDEAAKNLEEVVAKTTDQPEFNYHLGMIYLAKQENQKARVQFEQALNLAGNKPFSHADEIRSILKQISK